MKPGAAHVNGGKTVNPVKLPANLRDQVCMRCHLEGNARSSARAERHRNESGLRVLQRLAIRGGEALCAARAAVQSRFGLSEKAAAGTK
jgi:hypothetical protein